jgi:two-component system sensor histidine kinase DesK
VTGTPVPGANDELFGLVMREATTNILRHSQATQVNVVVEPRRLLVTNDGSAPSTRPLSGLARLAERCEAAGGMLRTSVSDGLFTTEATVA